MARELKALLNSGDQGASYTATISIARATVELPPEQRKCFADDKHPFTATCFDFLAWKCVSQSLQGSIQVVPSNVVADIVAGAETAHVAFDGMLESKLVAFCLWSEILNELDAVLVHDPAPRIAEPIQRTLTTLWQDAKRAAEGLAFKSRCGFADGHGGEAHGNELGRSHNHAAGSHVSVPALAITTAYALANAGVVEEVAADQGAPDNKDEGSSSDRNEDAPETAPHDGRDVNASEGADGQGRAADEGSAEERDDAAMDNQGGELELKGSDDVEEKEDEEEEEEVEEVAENTRAGHGAAVAVAGAGKSIRRLTAVLSPRPGSAAPSCEGAGKSPVAGKRKYDELVKIDPGKLAAEILRLDEHVRTQKRRLAKIEEVVSAKPGQEAATVITQSYDDLVGTVEKVLLHVQNAERVILKEAKAVAKDMAENRDLRDVLKRTAARLEDGAANLKAVVVDSIESAQKKLTDEVTRKIDGASSNIAATSERAITTSGMTNALNTVIAMLSGLRQGTDGPEEKESDGVAEVETGKRVADKETGKRAAEKETGKAESSRGGKRQKGPAVPSVAEILKSKGGAVDLRSGTVQRGTTRGDAAARPPSAPAAVVAGKGKAKVEEAPLANTTTATTTTALVPAASTPAAIATGQPGPSSTSPATPPAADVALKAKSQGRGGCKPPPAALKLDDDDDDSDADDDVELVLQRFSVHCETGGTSGKRKGCGIRPPPRGGEGMVGKPWLGGIRRWLGHHSLQEVQYLTAIAVMCYDKRVDHGLKLPAQQLRNWAEDISAADEMSTGLFATMHLRNLCGNVDSLGNAVAWAAVVGKEAADEEPDVAGAQEGLFASAVACAIAMVWETCNGLDLDGIVNAGYVAAQSAGAPEEKARDFVAIVTAVFKRARKENARAHTTEVTPKQVAEAIESAVVNRLGARLGDPTLVVMVAHEAVDVLMT
ncbi:unnamed protein product [Closterium sp. Naga37s-1]|nr:unnamed protein product [Closterium sp. Naga37s-1]